MELKNRDTELGDVLKGLSIEEKEELAKVLKFKSFVELKNYYEYEEDDVVLEKAIRYAGSDWMWDVVFGDDLATYKGILRSTAKNQKVKYTDNTDVKELERRIMTSIIDKVWQKMNEEEKQKYEEEICKFEDEMRAEDPDKLKEILDGFNAKSLRGISPAMLLSTGLAFRFGGFASYQILVIVMAAIARTLGVKIAMQGVTRVAFLAVPILNIISAIWLAWDVRQWICGPSFKKVIPSIFTIGIARVKQASSECTQIRKT